MKNQEIIEIYFTICGATIEEKYDGKYIKVSKCVVEYYDKKYENCISIKYNIALSTSLKSNEDELHSTLLKEAKYFLYLFNLLLTRPSELIFLKVKMGGGEEFQIKSPSKDAPLRLYNLAQHFTKDLNPFLANYTSHISYGGWPVFENLIENFIKKTNQFKKDIYIALRWFQKGCDETSSVDKLIAFWISFNSLYQKTDENERDAIKKYINNNVTEELAVIYFSKYEKTISLLMKFDIFLGRGSKKYNISQELGNSLRAFEKDYISIIKLTILSIYGIRNSLFHGSINLDDDDKQSMIEIADTLISEFLKELICFFILDEPLPDIKFKVKEQFGF